MDPEIGSRDARRFCCAGNPLTPAMTPHLYLRVGQVLELVGNRLDSLESVEDRLAVVERRSNGVLLSLSMVSCQNWRRDGQRQHLPRDTRSICSHS